MRLILKYILKAFICPVDKGTQKVLLINSLYFILYHLSIQTPYLFLFFHLYWRSLVFLKPSHILKIVRFKNVVSVEKSSVCLLQTYHTTPFKPNTKQCISKTLLSYANVKTVCKMLKTFRFYSTPDMLLSENVCAFQRSY